MDLYTFKVDKFRIVHTRALHNGHRQLVRWGQRDAGGWRGVGDLLPTRATDFRPDLEFLGPGGSMVCGSDVIAAELEEVVDLVVG